MAWTFERAAGPCKGSTGGVAWDGSHVLFSAVQEERILRYDPRTGSVDNFREYTGRTNGIAIGRVFFTESQFSRESKAWDRRSRERRQHHAHGCTV